MDDFDDQDVLLDWEVYAGALRIVTSYHGVQHVAFLLYIYMKSSVASCKFSSCLPLTFPSLERLRCPTFTLVVSIYFSPPQRKIVCARELPLAATSFSICSHATVYHIASWCSSAVQCCSVQR